MVYNHANTYDKILESYARRGEADIHPIIRKLPLAEPRESTIINIGCGPGTENHYLMEKGYGNVIGVDIDTEAAAYARRLDPRLAENFILADARCLPFRDDAADAIISTRTLFYLDADGNESALKEISRVLKEGGHFYFTTFPFHAEDEPDKTRYATDLAFAQEFFDSMEKNYDLHCFSDCKADVTETMTKEGKIKQTMYSGIFERI